MALDFTALMAQVERQTTIEASVESLLALLKANSGDPVKLKELVDKLTQNNDATVAAVVANTPAENAPPV